MRNILNVLITNAFLASFAVSPALCEINSLHLSGISRSRADFQLASLLTPRSDTLWLVVASRPVVGDAIELAQSYASTMGPALVVESGNGLYAVVVGTLNNDKAKPNLKALKELHVIPQDSFLSRGESLDSVVWTAFQQGGSLDFMLQPAYRQVIQRLQAAMTKLSLYNGPVDGLIGVSTTRSFHAYEAKYGVPLGDQLTLDSLAEIERTASDGFRNEPERTLAQSEGFNDAQSYSDAQAGGFSSSIIYAQAKSRGFTTQQEFNTAQSAGFQSKADFQSARSAGFSSAEEFRAAREAGLPTQHEYAEYRESGFSDPNDFRNAEQKGFKDKASFDLAEAKRLKAARQDARTLLSDAQTFLRLNPQLPNLVEIADKASALTAQMQANSADALNDSGLRLSSLLMTVPGFADFAASRAKERGQEIEKQKDQILSELHDDQQALKKWMALHLTSSKLPVVVGEVKVLDGVNGSADLDALTETRDEIHRMIASQDLAGDLARLQTDLAAAGTDPAKPSGPTITETDLNKVILKGALEDVVVFYNAGPTAPSLLRTLAGSFSFTKNEAAICLLGVEDTTPFGRAVEAALVPLGAKSVRIEDNCGVASIDRTDLFFLRRKTFLEGKSDFIVAYLAALESRKLRPFEEVDYVAIRKRIEQDEALMARIAKEVDAGTRPGYGAIVLSGKSASFCAVIDGEPGVHRPTLMQIAEFTSMSANYVENDGLDAAYEHLRREQCRVLYGSQDTLKKVSDALKRDGLTFFYAPVWFDQRDVVAAQDKLELERQNAIKQAEALRLAEEEEKRIAEQKREEDAKIKATQESLLRQQNGPAATAALNEFYNGLKKAILDQSIDARGGPVLDIWPLFPNLEQWDAQLAPAAWKATAVDASIRDYGTVNWKNRNLPAVLVKAVVKMASAERGEYRDACFILGAVIDDEFRMVRDPYESACDRDVSSQWATGLEFRSLWVAK